MRRPRTSEVKGRTFRITITFTARCSESLMMGVSCWMRSGRNKGINKCSLRRSSSRVGVKLTLLRQSLKRAYRDRGGGECSEDEREGSWDVEAHAKANLWAPRPLRGGARGGSQHRCEPWRKRMRGPSR